jgi:transposase InsO family protein
VPRAPRNRNADARGVNPTRSTTYGRRPYYRTWERLEIRHLRTRPYRPQTNGKAERFVQTMLRQWAYGAPASTSRSIFSAGKSEVMSSRKLR